MQIRNDDLGNANLLNMLLSHGRHMAALTVREHDAHLRDAEIMRGRMFLIDGEPFSLDEIRAGNEDDPETVALIEALAVGESVLIGGGAAAEFTVERTA